MCSLPPEPRLPDQSANASPQARIRDHLAFLYGAERGAACYRHLRAILDGFRRRNPALAAMPQHPFTQVDAFLITYGDQIREPGVPPLHTLGRFLSKHLKGVVSGVHILPFFPYSSDDGFSVVDYTRVDPALGGWEDVEAIGRDFHLMFDAVINHISRQSEWFQAFLRDDPNYRDFFITVEEGTDLSQVVRPRARPLLTRVETQAGEKWIWTTFSDDQIDLNYSNPDVLLRVIEILLLYVEKGAGVIRLDAIAYLWKTIGTSCIHLPQTHRVVQLLRAVLDAAAPHVVLITETNVPHEENISYLGDGTNEAQMVYQFPLAPLVLHAFHTGNATHLSRWAADLSTPSETTTFFNFLASHDGIGATPAQGILGNDELQALVDLTHAHGGHVSFRDNPDGTRSVYELNISYFDALSDPSSDEPQATQVARFIASQAIMLALAGVPGIYVHSMLGSRSYHAGVELTGRFRSINREKFERAALESELADPSSLRFQVFRRYVRLLRARAGQVAFRPDSSQSVVSASDALFALLRTSPDGREQVLCVHNVSGATQPLEIAPGALSSEPGIRVHDLLSSETFSVDGGGALAITVAPYQVLWLRVGPTAHGDE